MGDYFNRSIESSKLQSLRQDNGQERLEIKQRLGKICERSL